MPKKTPKPFSHLIPDAHYRCEGVDLGTEALAEIHFRDPDGGFFPPDQLFFVKIIDRKGDSECSSFFCDNCITAHGLKTSGKTTLKEAIASRFEQAHQQNIPELMRATGL